MGFNVGRDRFELGFLRSRYDSVQAAGRHFRDGRFFETAQSYWNTFRPIVTAHTELIDYIPNTQSLAVTVITPPDTAEALRVAMAERYPNVLFDLVLTDNIESVRFLFNDRVLLNRRFG